jgi:redox-sensitive bicupin YhaK (pirin superfamily)
MNKAPLIEIEPSLKDLSGLPVRRVLPNRRKRMVGPFIFLDHMGPFEFATGKNMEVRAHPHIGLSTLTYLYEGRIKHRDSLGNVQVIYPGEVNWMTAGKGIAHSERGVEEDLDRPHKVHGLQFWIALPDALEDMDPSFENYPKNQIPQIQTGGLEIDVIVGGFQGQSSPVRCYCKTLLLNAKSNSSGELTLHEGAQEICVYAISGEVKVNGKTYPPWHSVIFPVNSEIKIEHVPDSHFVIIGGEPFVTEKNIFWNFVSSSKEKIEAAKRNWNQGDFPMVPGEKDRLIAP